MRGPTGKTGRKVLNVVIVSRHFLYAFLRPQPNPTTLLFVSYARFLRKLLLIFYIFLFLFFGLFGS